MHSTRIATFLLGAWIGCCVLLDLLAVQNLRLAGQMMNAAAPAASEILQNAGREPMSQLLHHFASEQYRYYFSVWGLIQLPVVLLLAGVLYFAAEKRILPQILCLAILVLVVFELAINPEMTYRGREADFPPGSRELATQARVWALTEIWIGVETVKLAVGGVLTAFIISYKSKRRTRRMSDPIALANVD
jgi:hypothetical protein